MKTKQKAIRRIPTVSCPAPLDLSSDVEDMDYQLQSLKRDRSVSDVMGLDTCTKNTAKRICTEKRKQTQVVADSTSSHMIPSHCHNRLQQHDTADSVGMKSKECIRATQVSQQNLCATNNIVHAHTGQRRSMRQGILADSMYDLPTGDSIGAIVFEGGPNVETNYDVIIEARGGKPQRIDKLNPHYMSLHFPLLFVHGEEGYHLGLKLLEYHRCCNNGKVRLPRSRDSPAYIKEIFEDRHFMENIRAYNQMFAMTSLGAQVDDSINRGRGPYVFKVSGQIYHYIGSMCPELNKEPKFLQLYIYDTANEVKNRLLHFNKNGGMLRQDIVQNLIQVFDSHNELVKLFRTARDKIESADIPDFKIKLFGVVGSKQYDLPTGDSIGAIVFEGGPNVETNYDVIIEARGGQPQRIDKLNPHYMSLHFPLLFVHGEEGYHLGLKLLALPEPEIKALPTSTQDDAESTTKATTPPETDPHVNIPTAIPKIEPNIPMTPVQEQIHLTESSSTKEEKKKTNTRRQLFQATKTEAGTPSAKKKQERRLMHLTNPVSTRKPSVTL
ncbi:hypothetical protein CTI12_AA269790 [Artemisia annua]|uniref:Helitron helicase-like domain-containing protein n=1 Tax=Artemisia annua TaxID=35608 RepID=A0A2U1NFJ6_ARTAN|nr:hypothetical protein CTI12_AA269790 [Artemisia annua]